MQSQSNPVIPERYLNKILCADCLEIMKELPDKCVDLVLTDIPYNEVNRPSNGLRNLDKKDADPLEHDLSILIPEMARVCKQTIYVFCGIEQVSEIRAILRNVGFSTRHCFWEKTNPSPMNGEKLWLSSIENCIFGKLPKGYFSPRCESPAWRCPTEHNQLHPTQKPLKLFRKLVKASSEQGHLVFDPFLGSGTSVIAAHQLGRNFIGVDKNPEYCRIAEERLKRETQQLNLFTRSPQWKQSP